MYKLRYDRALRCAGEWLQNNICIVLMNKGAELTTMRMLKIQKQLRTQQISVSGKVEVLVNYWDKTCHILMMKAIEYGDSDMKLLHSRIVKVRPEIKNRLLTLYVVRCRALY